MDTTALLLLATQSVQPRVWALTSTTPQTNANNGTQLLSNTWTIPAYDALAGTTYEIEVAYNGTFENQTLGFKPSLNGSTVTTSGGDTIGSGFFTTGAGFDGTVKLKMMVTAVGSSGTVNLFISGGIGNSGARSSGTNSLSAFLSSQATAVAFNTTVSNTLAIDSVWGGSTASQTVSGHGSTFSRWGR